MCSVQFSARSCPILCYPLNLRTPGLPVHHQLPEFTQTHVHQVGDAIQQSHPLASPSPPAFDLSQNQGKIFPIESTLCMRWPKYWSFSFSISPSNEHPGLISFRMDWLDILAVQIRDLHWRHFNYCFFFVLPYFICAYKPNQNGRVKLRRTTAYTIWIIIFMNREQ